MTILVTDQNHEVTTLTLGRAWFWSFFFLVAGLTVVPAFADKTSDAQMAALYEQAFGNKKPAQQQIAAISPASSQNADMAALYAQTFGDKPQKNKKTDKVTTSTPTDLAALYAQAFGNKKVVRTVPSQINVELRVNKVVQGDVTVYSNKQRQLMDSTDVKTLLPLLEKVLKAHIYKRIKKELSSTKRITFTQLTKLGMNASYNSINLSLDLMIKPELRKPRVLSMRSKKRASVRDENKITASEISAFLNMYSNIGLTTSGGAKTSDHKFRFESSANIGDVVFENRTDINNGKWKSQRTTLTYDKPNDLKRFVVGEVATGNRNFQENLELTGFRVSKEFFMDPQIQIRPKANESFVLETDSEVEVYINERLHQRFYLDEGIYSLEDIGLYDGANNIRIKIKDEFGKITEKTSLQYYDSHLLKPKLSLWAFSVGILNNKEAYRNNKLLNKPIFSGYYQKGISKELTLSLDAQFSTDSYLLGAEAIASVPFGSLKQSIALSGGGSNDATGYAARFEFKPNIKRQLIGLDTLREDSLQLDTRIGRFITNWSISGEYRTKEFSMLNDAGKIITNTKADFDIIDSDIISDAIDKNENRKLQARLQTQFGFDLGAKWQGRLNIAASEYYDKDTTLFADLSASKRFNNGIRWSLGARYDTHDDFSVNMQLTIPLSREQHRRRKDIDLLVDSKNKSYESRLSVKPLSILGKNSLSGSLAYRQSDDSQQQQLDLNYKDSHFETQFYARNRSKGNGENSQRLNVGFNTSLACVGKHCATSYPINDSFALVGGPPNQQKPIAINNGNARFIYSDDNETGLPDNYTALIPAKGKRAVVPLESYRYGKINIDEATLPNGYDSEKTEFEVFPKYHQGYLLDAGGVPATIVDGVLIDQNRKPLPYKGGQWIPQGKKGKTIAFFSNKIGRFRMPSVPAGKYKLELFDYPDMQALFINVPDKKGQVYDTGKLVIIN